MLSPAQRPPCYVDARLVRALALLCGDAGAMDVLTPSGSGTRRPDILDHPVILALRPVPTLRPSQFPPRSKYGLLQLIWARAGSRWRSRPRRCRGGGPSATLVFCLAGVSLLLKDGRTDTSL